MSITSSYSFGFRRIKSLTFVLETSVRLNSSPGLENGTRSVNREFEGKGVNVLSLLLRLVCYPLLICPLTCPSNVVDHSWVASTPRRKTTALDNVDRQTSLLYSVGNETLPSQWTVVVPYSFFWETSRPINTEVIRRSYIRKFPVSRKRHNM